MRQFRLTWQRNVGNDRGRLWLLVASGGQGEAFAGNAETSVRLVLAMAGDSDCMMDVWAMKSNFGEGELGRAKRQPSQNAGEVIVRD